MKWMEETHTHTNREPVAPRGREELARVIPVSAQSVQAAEIFFSLLCQS